MKFWLKTRVHRVEKTKRFLAWSAGADLRKSAADSGVITPMTRMEEAMETAEITIERGWTDEAIHKLAIETHGGNYQGEPREFHWSNLTARNCIRHNLTNYEQLWKMINRGYTGKDAYNILRERVDDLIDITYPRYREDS